MSRNNARSRRLQNRPGRIVPATITAAVLTAVGVLTVIATLDRLITGTWPSVITTSAAAIAAQTWASAWVITASVIIALLGLILIIAGLKLGGFRSARLGDPDGAPAVGETDYVISTRAIARLAAARADTIDGVDGVSASASGNRVQLQITSSSEQTDAIRDRVAQEVTQVLTAAGLQPVPRVSATVRTRGI